jgi:hypothetical protein
MIDSSWQRFQHGFIRLYVRYVPFRLWRGSDLTFWKEFALRCGTLSSRYIDVPVDLDLILFMGICIGCQCVMSSTLGENDVPTFRVEVSREEKVKVIFYPVLCDFRKITAFWNVSRLCPFMLRLRTTCRQRRVWNIRVMLLAGENRSAWSKTYPIVTSPTINLPWVSLGLNAGLRSVVLATNRQGDKNCSYVKQTGDLSSPQEGEVKRVHGQADSCE